MKWKKGRRSDNVDDLRGQKVSPGLAVGGGGLGFLVLALLVAVLGGDPTVLLQQAIAPAPSGSSQLPTDSGGNDELADFVSVVLADTEDTWEALFQAGGGT